MFEYLYEIEVVKMANWDDPDGGKTEAFSPHETMFVFTDAGLADAIYMALECAGKESPGIRFDVANAKRVNTRLLIRNINCPEPPTEEE